MDYTTPPLSPELHAKAVAYLKEQFTDEVKAAIRARVMEHGADWMPPGGHFGWGMGVRNLLRDVITDQELPAPIMPEDYQGKPPTCGNWDDYYMAVVQDACV